MTSDQIEHKKANLAKLEASEAEARRMEGALAAAGVGGSSSSLRADGAGRGGAGGEGGRSAITGNPAGPSRRAGSSSSGSGGYGFLSALGHSLTGMIDVDPEATRRTNISKTRDTISQVRCPFSRPTLSLLCVSAEPCISCSPLLS
jgi:hypothetical protein